MKNLFFSFLLFPFLICGEESTEQKPVLPSPVPKTQPPAKIEDDSIVLITPPEGWGMAPQDNLPGSVRFMVVGKGSQPLPPSMNLSAEPFKGTLKQYLKIVKGMNEAQGYEWKDLGMISTEAGPASLSQVDTKSEWGEIRMMHVITVQNGFVYILTSAALKDEFSKFYKTFFEAMKTLRINKDIFEMVNNPQKKTELKSSYDTILKQWKNLLAQKKHENPTIPMEKLKDQVFESEQFQTKTWKSFKEIINQKFSDMGKPWQEFVVSKVANDLFDANP